MDNSKLRVDDEWSSHRWRVALLADPLRLTSLTALVGRHRLRLAGWAIVTLLPTADALAPHVGRKRLTVLPAGRAGQAALGAALAMGELDGLIALGDPAAAASQDGLDLPALGRLAERHNVALATNLASAECLVRALAAEGPNRSG
jgi:methylglyoxal synthase